MVHHSSPSSSSSAAENKNHDLNQEFLKFLHQSPTPFHAVQNMAEVLKEHGFEELFEQDEWNLSEGKSYFVKRFDSSIIAFRHGKKSHLPHGLRIVGAHTDSPCLKVKPQPDLLTASYVQCGVEVYGGVLLSTWFDRDLSLAGKITYVNKKNELKKTLINFKRPIAYIPNLAIHLNREANDNRSINKQKEMPPILFQVKPPVNGSASNGGTKTATNGSNLQAAAGKSYFADMIKEQLVEESKITDVSKILQYDLYFYDTQAPAIVGAHGDFLVGARIDNLLSCFFGLKALLESPTDLPCFLVCHDHEEVGSSSYVGAQGPFLKTLLERVYGHEKDLAPLYHQSCMISVDNAHGIHPNYLERHEPQHAPLINYGPVLKINHNQRYATNSETGGLFHYLCHQNDIPFQAFVVRSDMSCGSTIGPITSTLIGVKTVDIGVPTFGMHSIRELAGTADGPNLYKVLKAFYHQKELNFH